jgi:two-component system chemotaxis sensor kinase CheA
MYIEDSELRSLYKDSSAEHIQHIEAALMHLEQNPQDLDKLAQLLRDAHTLKGDSRMLGVTDVETIVHQIEECLMPVKQGQESLTSELCDRLYLAIDAIRQLAHTAITGEANQVDMFRLLANLMGAGDAPVVPPKAQPQVVEPPPEQQLSGDLDKMAQLLFGDDVFSPTDLPPVVSGDMWALEPPRWDAPPPLIISAPELDVYPVQSLDFAQGTLHEPLFDDGDDLFPADSSLPHFESEAVLKDFELLATPAPETNSDLLFPTEETIDLESNDELLFPLEGKLDLESNDELLFPDTSTITPTIEENEEIAPIAVVETAPPPQVVTPSPTAEPKHQIETMRVDAHQLDGLMAQAGEINVIGQQMASRLAELEALVARWEASSRDYQRLQSLLAQMPEASIIQDYGLRIHQHWEEMGQSIERFKQGLTGDTARLDLVTSSLESGVKKLRLLPLSTIFNLFPRMVRDLAKTQGKEIKFSVEGGDLLLDKRLLEEIKDPLMHILRNAIDHGIETPNERQQQGKSSTATLRLRVNQIGNSTTIEILDDGRGLDLQKIKATAVKRGLYTAAEIETLSIAQVQNLIFVPGFSTKSRVTEISGRGVGLDVVKTNIERLKGTVEVSSELGMGCHFQLHLSHAIGSSQVLLIGVGEQTYGLPLEYVEQMLFLSRTDIFALAGQQTTTIEGQNIAVAWLADLLSLPVTTPTSATGAGRTSRSLACIVLRSGQQKLALLIDRIYDQQLVTIKPPHPFLQQVSYLSGATILGNGRVCLILNPLDILTVAGGNTKSATPSLVNAFPTESIPSLLLVEDSIVIRTQMQRILKGAGYQVTVANDGLEGWEKLQTNEFDAVVSDVEMPRMSGLELTTKIRQNSAYGDLPIILVTTLAREWDRQTGLDAGANAYLTKGDFDQQLLLDTLNRLVN